MAERDFASVARSGASYLSGIARGSPPPLGVAPRVFWRELVRSLRAHFFFIPAGAALAGSSARGSFEQPWRVALVVVAAGVGWGVGQLLNDLLDVEADAVDAPGRASARGLLPPGPTLSVALVLGVAVAAAVAVAAPSATLLIPAAALLLIGYNSAKKLPLLGNVAHGALVAVAAAFGFFATMDGDFAFSAAAPTLGYVAAIAALYLQANYEKDRRGDRLAGYRTLAHVIGVRGSAALRALLSLALVWIAAPEVLVSQSAVGLALLGGVLVAASAVGPLRRGTEAASLRSYPVSIHGAALMMLAPTARVSLPLAVAVAALALLLTERARRQHENP